MENKTVSLNNIPLECVSMYNYLGIRITSQLNFNEHGKHLFDSAVNMVYTLGTLRYYMSSKKAVLIFKAFVLSKLEYGSVFCIGSNAVIVNRLQKLVNRCLSICF